MLTRHHRAIDVLAPAALALLAWADVPAQPPLTLPAQPVVVEFRALDTGGGPVLDLSAADVVLKVDGRPREVRSLDLVRFDGTEPGPGAIDAGPAPFATNDVLGEQRDILIVLEDDAIAPGTEAPIRAAVDRLLNRLAPGDRAGVLTIPAGGPSVGLTTDRAMVRASLAGLVGRSTRGRTDSDARCRTLTTIEALQNLILAVRSGPSTTVLFFSAGLTLPETVAPQRLGQPTETCIVRTNHYSDFKNIASQAGLNFYAVHAVDDSSSAQPASTNDLLAGLEILTGAANGDLIRLTAETAPNIDRMVRETGAFYRATFDPEPTERIDSVHHLEVSVARRGVVIRSAVVIPGIKADTRAPTGKKPSVSDLLRVGDVRRDLRLRAAAFPSRGETKNTIKMVVVFEPADSAEPLASAAVALYDQRDKLVAQATLRTEDLGRMPPFAALSVKPGTYRLRVAAADRGGRLGTLDTQVRAQLVQAVPVTLSAMILGTRTTGRFAPKLLFRDDPALITYVEAYGVPKAAELSAVVELAATAEGPALGAVTASVLPGNEEETWQIQAGIALSQVPPGDYILRVLVVVDQKLVGKVVRGMRKEQ
ncbi:MAG: hypothetical protein AB1806_07745 [Acidobacteriota bacterium]